MIMKQILSLIIFTLALCFSAFAQIDKLPCPNMEIIAPVSVVQPGETMFFSVSVGSEVKNYDVKYKWTVDRGTIINGQNTNTIQISTKGLSDTTVNAKFEIEGLPENCESKISEIGVIAQELPVEPYDQYRKISLLEEVVRLDSFIIALQQYPDSKGFIWITINEKATAESAKKHIRRLVKHIKFRKFAKERIIFAVEKSSNHHTILVIVPNGAEFPSCEKCEIIKGKDLR